MLDNFKNLIFSRRSLGASLLLALTFFVGYYQLLRPADRLIYDANIRLAERDPLEDIVIIAVDKYSLEVFGHWPWSRNIHAQLIEKLNQANPKVILLDLLFSEQSNEVADQALASAIEQSKKVILPVAPELFQGRNTMIENLPIPALLEAAAGIGHVDRELDLDNVARRTYLYAGLSGQLSRPNISLKAISVAGDSHDLVEPESLSSLNQISKSVGSTVWQRDQEYLIPFAGSPKTFPRISYADVLNKNFDINRLADKYVLIGVTAAGLGDVTSTPVSGKLTPMPGVEVIANEIDSLRRGLMISNLNRWYGIIIACTAAFISYFLWGLISPGYTLLLFASIFIAFLAADAILLHVFRIWFAPATSLLAIGIGYLGHLWDKLTDTVKYLNSELSRLSMETVPMLTKQHKDANKALKFLMELDGFHGSQMRDNKGKTLFQSGTLFTDDGDTKAQNINTKLKTVWVPLNKGGQNRNLGLSIDEKLIHESDAIIVAKQLGEFYSKPKEASNTSASGEFISDRIELVSSAYSRIRFLNSFISEVLDQIYNSVIVTDSFGNVVLANDSARKLFLSMGALHGFNIVSILDSLEFKQEQNWFEVFSEIMFQAQEFVSEAQTSDAIPLLVEVTRYRTEGEENSGMVFNFTDVTTLKESERRRRELLEFLSHDLRSPLASLIATSDLAKLRPKYRDSDTFVESVKNNATRALRMADDFLALIRAESIDESSFKPVNFNSVINRSLETIDSSAKAKNISIDVTNISTDNNYFINGDEVVLERVLINLLSNAIKYSPEYRQIELGVDKSGDILHCWVKDHGYGIDENDLGKIFKRFERIRLEEHADESGTGLGLTFVKSSIERHRGSIKVESNLGMGSCFHIYLPLLSYAPASKVALNQ